MKAKNLPADLVHEWAVKHAAANAKLEGLELPEGYVPSEMAQRFLADRKTKGLPPAPLHERIKMEALWG